MSVGRAAFAVAIVAWLVHQLSAIGWLEVWDARPRTPWFYVSWLGLYLQLPIVESLIFGKAWGLPPRNTLLPLMHKRTLNQDVVFGLGEGSFFMWARQRVALPDRRIAGTIKDNLIALTVAAWVSIALLVPLAGSALWALLVPDPSLVVMSVIAAAVVLAVTLAVRFRRVLLTLPPRAVLALFAAHLSRILLLVCVLQVVQWWVVIPEAPGSLWVSMLIVTMLVQRVPFIPARDLAGIGAILGVMALPAGYEATIAAMLVVRMALDKICNLALVGMKLLFERRWFDRANGRSGLC